MKSTKYIFALILSLLFSFDSTLSQWTDLNPWNTAKITGIEIVDSTYFVATENGIWRSQDSLQTWQRINQGLPNLRISKLFANDKVAIATIDSVGVFLSSDKGNTWTKSEFKHSNIQFTDIDTDSNLIYIATFRGLYSSSDYGETWSDTLLTAPYIKVKCIGKDLYCGSIYKGIYYSSNQGKNWELRNTGIQNLKINSIDGNDQLLLATTEQNILADIYLSTNKGISWTRLNKDAQDEKLFTKPLTTAIVTDSALYVRDLLGTVYTSKNLGKDWVQAYYTGNRYEFAYKIYNDILYMSTAENQIIFNSLIKNYQTIGLSLIALHSRYINTLYSTGNSLLIGSNKGISYSSNNGTDLKNNYFSMPNSNVFTSSGSDVFALNSWNIYQPTFLYSQNSGETWDKSNFEGAIGTITNIYKYQDTLYAISSNGYTYTTNKGKDWSQAFKHRNYMRYLYSKENQWYFWEYKDTNAFLTLTLDKGQSFIDLVNMTYLQQTPNLFHDGYALYLFSSLKINLLTNATNQIIDLTKNLPLAKDSVTILNIFVKDETLFCIIYNRSNIYNANSIKLFYLKDMNSQWQEFTNKENALLGDKLYADDKYLYSFNPRFYRTELSNFKSTSVEIDSQSENTVLISLAQDILSFNLPNELNSSIEIYNSLGKTMHVQTDIESIDVSNFANGVYFVKIQVDGKTIMNKFVKY